MAVPREVSEEKSDSTTTVVKVKEKRKSYFSKNRKKYKEGTKGRGVIGETKGYKERIETTKFGEEITDVGIFSGKKLKKRCGAETGVQK